MAASPRTVRELEHSIEIDHANAAAHYYLSTCYLEARRSQDAERAYLEAVRLDPWQKDPRHYSAIKRRQAAGLLEAGENEGGLHIVDTLAKIALDDPLASNRDLSELAGMKGRLLRKNPTAWLKTRREEVKELQTQSKMDASVKLAEQVWTTVLRSPFATAGQVTEAALTLAAALAASGELDGAIELYRRVLDASELDPSAWQARKDAESRLLELHRRIGATEEARALRAQIASRRARAQTVRYRRRPQEILLQAGLSIIVLLAIQGVMAFTVAALVAGAYGVAVLISRARRPARVVPWRGGKIAAAYMLFFVGLAGVAALVLTGACGKDADDLLFGDRAVAFAIAALSPIGAGLWGWFRFPRLPEVAQWTPPPSRREKLHACVLLLSTQTVLSCVVGYVPSSLLIYWMAVAAAIAAHR